MRGLWITRHATPRIPRNGPRLLCAYRDVVACSFSDSIGLLTLVNRFASTLGYPAAEMRPLSVGNSLEPGQKPCSLIRTVARRGTVVPNHRCADWVAWLKTTAVRAASPQHFVGLRRLPHITGASSTIATDYQSVPSGSFGNFQSYPLPFIHVLFLRLMKLLAASVPGVAVARKHHTDKNTGHTLNASDRASGIIFGRERKITFCLECSLWCVR